MTSEEDVKAFCQAQIIYKRALILSTFHSLVARQQLNPAAEVEERLRDYDATVEDVLRYVNDVEKLKRVIAALED